MINRHWCSGVLLPISLLLSVALLASCGGGGGGAPPPGNPGAGVTPQPAAAFTRLWVPNYNAGEVRAWNRASTLTDREGQPDVVITLPPGSRPNAVAFDPTGAMWVTDSFGARLFKFGRSQLATTGTPTPLVTIDTDGQSLQNAIGLAFDRDDNLWVAAGGRVEMYAPANLDQSGPTTPDRVLTTAGLDIPAGIVFDANGILWLGNASFTPANNSVLAFTPDQQAAGGAQAPRLTLRSAAFALVEGLRFDAAGDLWVASNDGLNIAKFAAASLAVPAAAETRTLAPVASIEANGDDAPTGRSVRKPGGIVFDVDGNLYVNSERGLNGGLDSGVVRFSAAQLAFFGPQVLLAAVVVTRSTSNPGFGGLALELP